MATKVFINPGHDRTYDSGAVSPRTGLREADVADEVGNLVSYYLEAAGCATIVIQSDNLNGERPDLPSVCETANDWPADLFISIHCNAFNEIANGTETLYHPYSVSGSKLADCIQKQLVKSMDVVDRGTKSRSNLCVLNATDMPAVLVEMAFIDNEHDEYLLSNFQHDFARAIARGVTDYIVMNKN